MIPPEKDSLVDGQRTEEANGSEEAEELRRKEMRELLESLLVLVAPINEEFKRTTRFCGIHIDAMFERILRDSEGPDKYKG